MSRHPTIDSLLESGKIHQWIQSRFDLFDQGQNKICEAQLMELILDVYYNDSPVIEEGKYKNLSILQVLHYLKATHQLYLTKTLPEIEQSMISIRQRMFEKFDLLESLVLFFNDFKLRLIDHIYMEEESFFPYILLLNAADEGLVTSGQNWEVIQSKSVDNFIDDHDSIEQDLKDVSKIIHYYSEEGDIPFPFKIFLNQIEIFEMDLKKHAIIEDFVLVPMAQKLEKKIKSKGPSLGRSDDFFNFQI